MILFGVWGAAIAGFVFFAWLQERWEQRKAAEAREATRRMDNIDHLDFPTPEWAGSV